MLNRQNRLKTKDFKSLERGSNIITPLFKCKTIKNKEGKLAIVITKKILKRSVDRHKLKRRICYAYKELAMNKKENIYIIQAINKSEDLKNYQKIKQSLCGTQ
jgi:ribonuclease P protein component